MDIQETASKGTVEVFVRDQYGQRAPIGGAAVRISAIEAPYVEPEAAKPETGAPPVARRPRAAKAETEGHAPPGGTIEQHPERVATLVAIGTSDVKGGYSLPLAIGQYRVAAEAFGVTAQTSVTLRSGCRETVLLEIPIGFSVETAIAGEDCTYKPCAEVREGGALMVRFKWRSDRGIDFKTTLTSDRGNVLRNYTQSQTETEVRREYVFDSTTVRGAVAFEARLETNPFIVVPFGVTVLPNVQSVAGDLTVSMRRAVTEITDDLPLWIVIRKSTEALGFNNYQRFIDHVLCGKPLSSDFTDFERSRIPAKKARFDALQDKRFLPFTDADSYRLLKVATEAFVVVNCGVALSTFPFDQDDLDYTLRRIGRTSDLDSLWLKYLADVNGTPNATLPYLALIRQKLPDVRIKNAIFGDGGLPEDCFGILREKLTEPCLLELIWSYWQEEGMLVQTFNAITRRFQNVHGPASRDPLANTEIDPLRPLNNLLWGHIQDEQHRLSVVRRNYEYDHHYGVRLEGKAVQKIQPVDTRSKFLEAFHNLLHMSTIFFQQDDDTTVVADGFPLLNGLKEAHLILSQGAHNQFGDLPSTSRIEMLMQQWVLARPEFREYLPTRIMVAYPEPWMDRVDAMKKLQGWTDTSVMHFRTLAVFGEQILLSIRFGAWSDANDPAQAANWARFWRPEIQGYIHSYRAVTGVDLTGEMVDFTMPSVLLRSRLAAQSRSV